MSMVYKTMEARRNFATPLGKAIQEGGASVRRREGQMFVIRPEQVDGSPLDVKGDDLRLTAAEIVAFIHKGRRSVGPE